jgi:predicted PurR-regulated permease PerM
MEPKQISISTETILKTAGIIIAIIIAWLIKDILLLLFSATFLAGILYPFAEWAAKHKVPKGLAVGLVYLALVAVVALIISFLIPALLDQARLASTNFGGTFGWLREGADDVREMLDRFGLANDTAPTLATLANRLQETALGLVTSLNDVIGTVGAILIVLVLSFYLVVDDAAVKTVFHQLIPDKYRDFVSHVGWAVMNKLGDWARGQLTLSAIVGLASFLFFNLIGMPYALLLALVAGISEFVPYLGSLIAGLAAVFVALTVSPWKALGVLIFVLIFQQIQGHIITPKIMQRAVGLHPVVSIAAFLIGAKLFGVVGAIFSIPVATAISVAIGEYGKFREALHRS